MNKKERNVEKIGDVSEPVVGDKGKWAFFHKRYVAPVIAGIIGTFIGGMLVNYINKDTISGLESNIVSMENNIIELKDTILLQQNSLIKNNKHIGNLEIKLEDCTNNGNIFNESVTARDIIGTQTSTKKCPYCHKTIQQ